MPAAWYPMKFAPKDGRIIILNDPNFPVMPLVRWTRDEVTNEEGWQFLKAAFNTGAELWRLDDTKWIYANERTRWASLASTGLTVADVFPEAN